MTPDDQIRAQIGAEILLALKDSGTFPYHDRLVVGKAIHDAFIAGGWDSVLTVRHDVYGTKRKSSPCYWAHAKLDYICLILEKQGQFFQHLPGAGWKFLSQDEASEWKRATDQASHSKIKTRNRKCRAINKIWPGNFIAPLEIKQRQIEDGTRDEPGKP